MLRATVTDTDPREPARVWVTIPQKYGNKPVRVFTRVQVSKGDHVYVTNTSVTRVPQWVVFDQQTEVGTWGNPYPHTHPIGQVDGLVDWVKEYEAWAKDHAARLDAADKRIAEGKAEVDAARKDLTQAQTDIAEAVRKATLEQARLDQAEANLDQMGRNLLAAGGRISANETALGKAEDRLASAETTVQKTSTDLTALQGTVGDVQSKVTASDQKALEALTKAGAAQTSADGKNTITRSTSPASQPGKAVGDTHFTMSSMGGGGTVTRQQRWDGSTWQDESLSHQVLASLDLGKATVGELDGIMVKAGSITADRLSVGPSENSITDAGFTNLQISANRVTRSGGAWVRGLAAADTTNYYQWQSYTGLGRWHFYPLPGTSFDMSGMIPTSGNTPWRFRTDVNSGGGAVQWGVYYINRDGSTELALVGEATVGGNARRTITADWTAPSTVMGMQPFLQFTNGDVARTSTVYGGAQARPKVGTVLIEDGAVTGEKVQAHSVSGAIGQFLKVEAQSGTFTDSLTGRNARLLGETVAESINITGKLRGRDAILSGTVDVGQLNVTGAMSAKIISTATLQARQGFFTDGLTAQDAALLGTTVAEKLVVTDAFSARVVNAMTTQTRQLVVTEDAILNRATVVQSLVTPELISQKANIGDLAARMITSGLLQTTTAANRGVKIDNNGIRAWDSSGRQTVQLNGTSNYITGSFSTAETGQRVRIRNASTIAGIDFFASNNTDDHLGIWYDSPDSNVLNAVAKIQAMTSVQNTRENPALFMWPMRGTFGFQGRWGQDTDATKFVVLTNFAGLGPGAYNTITINYQSAFPTNNSLRCPFVSVESATGADVMATVVQQTESNIRINIINQSGGKSSGTLVLRVVTFNINA